MATIKIYDPNTPDSSIEFMNEGDETDGIMQLCIDHPQNKNYLYFDLQKEEAIDLIYYLRKQFTLP